MGNRAIITLEDRNGASHPVALYLHWHGGLESVLAFVTFTWNTFPRGHEDMFTFHARLCQVIGNFFPDGLSLYALPLAHAGDWSTQHGIFHFSLSVSGPRLVGRDYYVERAKSHPYWTGTRTIFHLIAEKTPATNTAPYQLSPPPTP